MSWSLWLRALAYMLLVGGGWLVILPLFVLRLEYGQFVFPLRSLAAIAGGAAVFAVGALLAFVAGYFLISRGHGTPFPLDPTRRLVTTGPYAHVRNPQAIAMVLAVIGEIIAVKSQFLWGLLPLTLIYLEILMAPWEERKLVEQYGKKYEDYSHKLHKWIPRVHPYHLD